MSSETLLAIQNYIDTQCALTLCVMDEENLPWCASCFYVLERVTMILYLMSEKSTRHGRLMQHYPMIAGTIFQQPDSVATLQGVQFTGEIQELLGGQRKSARALYVQRFPIARSMQAPIWGLHL